jgi:Ca2+-binding RTX toxin-like protein
MATYYDSTGGYPNNPEDYISPGVANPVYVAPTLPAINPRPTIVGGPGNDDLTGTSGNDVLDGGGGDDRLDGGLGDDGFYVTVGDQVADSGGIDTIYFSGAGFWRLAPGFENIAATGTGPTDFRGNNQDNVMIGNDAENYFNGRAGNDTMIGLGGNDHFDMSTGRPGNAVGGLWTMGARFIDGGDGIDTIDYDGYVRSAVTIDLGAGTASGGGDLGIGSATLVSIEDAVGGQYDDRISGSSAPNHLYGRDGNDTLIGVGGNDVLDGGLGNDSYYVSAGDVIVDAGGIDTVYASGTWALHPELENITAVSGATSFQGNNLTNVMTGNAADNYFNPRAGDDTLIGDAGNDYFDMSTGRTATPGTRVLDGGAGTDTVDYDGYARSAVTIDLAAGTASGGGDLGAGSATLASIERAVGGAYNDQITGSSGPNELFGRGGNDSISGGGGDDILWGGVGDDTLAGGAGNDVLVGSYGNDTYLFGRGDGSDIVRENARGGDGWWADNPTAGNSDLVQFGAGISADQIWLQRTGDDLVASVIGTSDQLVIENWYLGADNRVEQLKTASGAVLLEGQVQNLVNAMAAFAPPAPGVTALPASYASTLDGLIAANWR